MLHKHCDKTPPRNGALICDFQYHGQFCMAMCNSNYDFEWAPKVSLYICIFDTGKWVTDPRDEELQNLNKSVIWPDCSEKITAETRKGTVFQYFEGECLKARVRSEMHSNFLEQFQTAALGRYIGCNPHTPERCTPKNVSIICYSNDDTAFNESSNEFNKIRNTITPCTVGTMWYALADNSGYSISMSDKVMLMKMKEEIYDPQEQNNQNFSNNLCKRCVCTNNGKPMCSTCKNEYFECNDVIRSQCYPGVSLQIGVQTSEQLYQSKEVISKLCECAFCKSDMVSKDFIDSNPESSANLNFGFSWELYSKYVELTCSNERARNIALYHQHEANHVFPNNLIKSFNSNQSASEKLDQYQYLKPNILALWNIILKHPSHFANAHYPKYVESPNIVKVDLSSNNNDSSLQTI
ncbi:unnamed protein product [Gordionus sp. m RMFG-2023]